MTLIVRSDITWLDSDQKITILKSNCALYILPSVFMSVYYNPFFCFFLNYNFHKYSSDTYWNALILKKNRNGKEKNDVTWGQIIDQNGDVTFRTI